MRLTIDLDENTYFEAVNDKDVSVTNLCNAVKNGLIHRERSTGRSQQEKAVIDKVKSVFDSTEYIQNFDIQVKGGVEEMTTIKYTFEEVIRP